MHELIIILFILFLIWEVKPWYFTLYDTKLTPPNFSDNRTNINYHTKGKTILAIFDKNVQIHFAPVLKFSLIDKKIWEFFFITFKLI